MSSMRDSSEGAAARRPEAPAKAQPAVLAHPGTSAPSPVPGLAFQTIQALQRSAGNAATQGLVKGTQGLDHADSPPLAVQRHESWEHTLMGNTSPSALGQAVVSRRHRDHVLERERDRIEFFQTNPYGNPVGRFPEVRWVELRGSRLWVSYGELNALADYLPNPGMVDSLDRSIIVPVLQKMRQGTLRTIHDQEPENREGFADESGEPEPTMAGAAGHGLEAVHSAAGEVKALDRATAGLGSDRYAGLVARNACHFAPFSWNRWTLYHNEARAHALRYNSLMKECAPIGDTSVDAPEDVRQALLNNGYADHFLQDSFAAGHLINKTLVMQWFAEYLLDLGRLARPWFGAPSRSTLRSMTEAAQPGMAGRHLYGGPNAVDARASDDRTGILEGSVDPQTAEERTDRSGRVAGSGVRAGGGRTQEENYQLYLQFLNNAFMQKAAGDAHDYFNERGLDVVNGRGERFRVGGDQTLLDQSDQRGAELAGEASEMSRNAVDQLLVSGETDITVESILALTPQHIGLPAGFEGPPIPLEMWQDSVLRQLCWDTIFPRLVGNNPLSGAGWAGRVLRVSSTLVEGGVSIDAGTAPPEVGPLGDFPLPDPESPVPV